MIGHGNIVQLCPLLKYAHTKKTPVHTYLYAGSKPIIFFSKGSKLQFFSLYGPSATFFRWGVGEFTWERFVIYVIKNKRWSKNCFFISCTVIIFPHYLFSNGNKNKCPKYILLFPILCLFPHFIYIYSGWGEDIILYISTCLHDVNLWKSWLWISCFLWKYFVKLLLNKLCANSVCMISAVFC